MDTRNQDSLKEMLLVHGIVIGLVSCSFVSVVAIEIAGKFI